MKDIRTQFTALSDTTNLVYLDSAATALVPEIVLDAMSLYYKKYPANVHRGLYDMSIEATQQYEGARKSVAQFIGASPDEVVFTSGTTQSINMLAVALKKQLTSDDVIVLTRYEHHANLIPWQQLASEVGCELRFIDLILTGDEKYTVDMESARTCIDAQVKVVAYSAASHVLGTIAPIQEIQHLAKAVGAITVIDAAQAIAHMPLNVKEIDCDFLVFSGHKLYGPTGVGVLYGKKEHLEKLAPVSFGGGMVETVSYTSATWAKGPAKFEPGTPSIAAVIGLGAAVKFITSVGWKSICAHEKDIIQYAQDVLGNDTHIEVLGPTHDTDRIAVFSFCVSGIHAHDVAEICNRSHVAVRAGHHCAIPLLKYIGKESVVRASCGIYTSREDIERLATALTEAKRIFSVT
mgnify:CR=1 FL=1